MPTYKFRVLIDTESDEEIFRDIVISSEQDFEKLYYTIIHAFGFEGNQLASFYLSNESWDRGHEIALIDMGLTGDSNAPFIMAETRIADVVKIQHQKLILVYDFLKMWCFLIDLIAVSDDETDEAHVVFEVGTPPNENDREIDFDQAMTGAPAPDLGNDIDDIFSDMDEDEDEFGGFENIDDFDI